MSHHTVITQSLCFTTQLPYYLHVSPHSYHTIFMFHHTVTTQSLHFTTQLPYNLYVSPHSYHTIFMFPHTFTIQNATYFQWLSHSNFMSTTHTKILYPKLPNFRDLCTSKFSGLIIQASCVAVHMTDMPVLLTVRQKAHIHEHKALALNFTSNRRVINILCTAG